MSRRVFLHVGAPKTGTTALQTRLQRNRARLLDHGVLVPRATSGPRPAGLLFRASLDLTGVQMGKDPAEVAGSWDALVEQVTAHDGTVVASHEGFVRCDEAAVARVVAELGAGGELHVVYSARDLGRQLVSGWVEGLKNGATHDLATHLEQARTGELLLSAAFDVPAVLGRWLAHLPPERVHLVTVPPSSGDRSLLWRRFADLMGLHDEWAPKQPRRLNESVGVAQAQVLLGLNHLLDGSNRRGGPHQRIVRRTVVGQGLAGRQGPRVEVPPGEIGWLTDRVAQYVAWLVASGVDLVGDLDELRPTVDPATWLDATVPHEGMAEEALAALAAVVIEADRRAEAELEAGSVRPVGGGG